VTLRGVTLLAALRDDETTGLERGWKGDDRGALGFGSVNRTLLSRTLLSLTRTQHLPRRNQETAKASLDSQSCASPPLPSTPSLFGVDAVRGVGVRGALHRAASSQPAFLPPNRAAPMHMRTRNGRALPDHHVPYKTQRRLLPSLATHPQHWRLHV